MAPKFMPKITPFLDSPDYKLELYVYLNLQEKLASINIQDTPYEFHQHSKRLFKVIKHQKLDKKTTYRLEIANAYWNHYIALTYLAENADLNDNITLAQHYLSAALKQLEESKILYLKENATEFFSNVEAELLKTNNLLQNLNDRVAQLNSDEELKQSSCLPQKDSAVNNEQTKEVLEILNDSYSEGNSPSILIENQKDLFFIPSTRLPPKKRFREDKHEDDLENACKR